MKRALLIETAIIALLIVFFIRGWNNRENTSSFFSNALRDANISEKVVVNEKRYDVIDGKIITSERVLPEIYTRRILRLAYAKTLARRSPLMALAGTDPARLDAAINELVKTRDVLADMQKNPHDKGLVKSSLYPIAFLKSLANLERTRIKFLSSGDEMDEESYESAMRKTLLAYRQDISNFRLAFLNAVPENAKPFVAGGSSISRAGILQALAGLESGVRETETKFSKRSNCLNGIINQCDITHIKIPELSIPEMETISSALLRQSYKIRNIYAEALENNQTLIQPLVATSKSECTEDIPGAALFVLNKAKSVREPAHPWPLLYVGNIRFVESSTQTRVPFFGYFHERGVKYVLQSSHVHYECFENGRDIEKILGIDSVISFGQKSRVSKYATGEIKDKLYQSEVNFSAPSRIITEKEAVEYILLSQSLIKNDIVPEEIRHEIISFTLQLKNLSTKFNLVIFDIASRENNHANLVQDATLAIPYDAALIFYSRSGFMQLFLEHNPSATGMHQSFFERDTTPLEKQPYVFYSLLPNTRETDEIVTRDIKFYYNNHSKFSLNNQSR